MGSQNTGNHPTRHEKRQRCEARRGAGRGTTPEAELAAMGIRNSSGTHHQMPLQYMVMSAGAPTNVGPYNSYSLTNRVRLARTRFGFGPPASWDSDPFRIHVQDPVCTEPGSEARGRVRALLRFRPSSGSGSGGPSSGSENTGSGLASSGPELGPSSDPV